MKKVILTLLIGTFLFLSRPSVSFAVCSYNPGSYTSYTQQSNSCIDAGEDCKVSGSTVIESGHGCDGCDGTYCINVFWSQTLSCGGNADAKAYCGQATCKGQSQACGSSSECCSGFACTNGVCAGSCTGNEPDSATCGVNGGTWVTVGENTDSCGRRQLTTGQRCISLAGIGAYCKADGCDSHNSNACNSSGGCGAADCTWINDSTIQNISCSYCKCNGGSSQPPPTNGCTNSSWALTTWIGYGLGGGTQSTINNGTADCLSNVNWISNASVNVPAVVPGGNVEIRALCTMPDSPNLGNLSLSDITNNISIASSVGDEKKTIYSITAIKQNNPGQATTLRSSRPTQGAYCAKNDDLTFCANSRPGPASDGYPGSGEYVNDSTNVIQAAPVFDNKASGISNSGADPLTWTHKVEDGTNGLLLVGISYRGDKNGDGTPFDKIFENGVDDGDADDHVKSVKLTKSNGTTLNFARVPNSHAQFIQGSDRGGKRHTVFWYLTNPSVGNHQITVSWKGTFPDPKESVGGSVSYTGVNVSSPFAATNGASGLTSGCSSGVCSGGEPTISHSGVIAKTAIAIISGQTDSNGYNPPDLQKDNGSVSRWKRTTSNQNIFGQGASLTGSSTPSTLRFDWKYGYIASWSTSSVLLNSANTRVANTLYWENPDWGYVCTGPTKENFVTILDTNSNPIFDINGNSLSSIAVGNTRSLSLVGKINLSPVSDTTYKWYVETANISGTQPNTGDRKKSPVWSFKVKAGPNLTAYTNTVTVNSLTQTAATTYTIKNTGGVTLNNVQGTLYDSKNNQNYGGVHNFGTLTPGQTSSPYGVTFPAPAPGNYFIRVLADPNNTIAETNESDADNRPTRNYTVPNRSPYYQTTGAGVTSLGTITSILPISKFLSQTGSGTLDAGIISARNSPLNLGAGGASQNPGGSWNRAGSATVPSPYPQVANLSYTTLFNTVLTNAGVNPTSANTSCGAAPCSFTSGNYTIYVYYNSGDINTYINSAPTSGTVLLIPASGAATPTVSTLTTAQTAGKRVVVFVNGNLNLSGSGNGSGVNISTTDNTAGIIFVVNGNINAGGVNHLDGVYLLSGQLLSDASATQLTGNGSVIGTGANTFNFTRTYGTTGAIPEPANLWVYQPKYLWLFRNILTQPSYSWNELPPE